MRQKTRCASIERRETGKCAAGGVDRFRADRGTNGQPQYGVCVQTEQHHVPRISGHGLPNLVSATSTSLKTSITGFQSIHNLCGKVIDTFVSRAKKARTLSKVLTMETVLPH